VNDTIGDVRRLAQGLRMIGKGFELAASAFDGALTDDEDRLAREVAMIKEWGSRGLSQKAASQLCQRHGFAPQKIGAWVNGSWAEIRADGLRYLTPNSHKWAANV
jgi:hypothetical protein